MCGICGFLSLDSQQPVDQNLLARMNQTLYHRGPDSQGEYLDGNLGMAMRRLSIIDVAGGDQPIFSEDGDVVVVYNGEIYNFQELRQELEKFGHRFQTQSDTEVIVHAYEQWGDQALGRFNGMFVLSLWDRDKKRLLLARDRMGKKPLYWHISKHGLLWASEAKALLIAPWVERRINLEALHHYLTLQYIPDPLTIYEGMQRLAAAHKLVIEQGCQPQVSCWWQLSFEPKWQIDEQEAVEQAKDILTRAVKRRLISEVPLGAFLSGGIDSSIVVALMARNSATPVKTFTIGFQARQFSEAAYAAQVAQQYQTDHHEFIFEPKDLTRIIEGVVEAMDEPFADPAALPLYELARQTRKHVTVALCGDGGDETLAGYTRYALDRYFRFIPVLPAWLGQKFLPWVLGWLPESADIPEDRNPIAGVKRLGQVVSVSPKASLARWGSYFSHYEKIALYNADLRHQFANLDTADWLVRAYDQAQADHWLDRTLSADHVTYLSGDLLPKTDRMTMAHSVEGRAPFLDMEWVEWTARLPTRYKVRGLQTKWLLKAAFGEIVPAAIARRGKQGFSLPVGLWLRNELNSFSQECLRNEKKLDNWFCMPSIERLIKEHQFGHRNHGKRIWALMMFALWVNRYG